MERNVERFKWECRELLNSWDLDALRRYGRDVELRNPSVMTKASLIETIIGVLCGEITETRNNRGAPVKTSKTEPSYVQAVLNLKKKYLPEDKEAQEAEEAVAEPIQNLHLDNMLQLNINMNSLNSTQKRLLNHFIRSL